MSAFDTGYSSGFGTEPTSTQRLYCTPEQVAALLGVPVESLDADRVNVLIEMASGVLDLYVCDVPEPTPGPVSYVAASMVARQATNPSAVTSEAVAGYRVQYAAAASSGMVPTEDDLALLGPWLCTGPGYTTGTRAYTTLTPSAMHSPTWPYDWWQRDLDSIEELTP
jgi:hypothetical protein